MCLLLAICTLVLQICLLWYMQEGLCAGLHMDFDVALLLHEDVRALAKPY